MVHSAIFDALVAVVLGFWVVANVVGQGDNAIVASWRSSVFCTLLAVYQFFAPGPISNDYMLWYRKFSADEGPGGWIQFYTCRRNRLSVIWNPGHRIQKAISDLTERLGSPMDEEEPVYLRFGYIAFLQIVSTLAARDPHCDGVQFLITFNPGYEDGQRHQYFLSQVHALEGRERVVK